MRRTFTFFLLLFAVVALVSCLGSDGDVTYYDDTAITAFSLGTLNRTYHTLSSEDEDSTYTDDFDASDYYFYIDQENCEIYNPDSLPTETDNSKVVCSISSKNGGIVVVKNIDSDTLVYYSSSDSIDFSVPREVWVFSLSGYYYRVYTVNVNVHQEDSIEFKWSSMSSGVDAFSTMTGMRAVEYDDRIYVFGSDGAGTDAYYTDVSDGGSWTEVSLDERIEEDGEAYDNVVVKDGYIYVMCSDGFLLRTADGETWEDIGETPLSKLIGAGGEDILYGYGDGTIMMSEDNGATWSEDALDDDASYLPVKNFHCSMTDMATNSDMAQVVIIGNRDEDEYPADTMGVSWSKIEEYSEGSETHSWIYHDLSDYPEYTVPRMEGLTVVQYGDYLLAMGGKGLGASTEEAYTAIYYSGDYGLSWHTDGDMFYFPDGFDTSATCVSAAKDDDNHLWIMCGGTGQVWKGRLNYMGWATRQTVFTE